MVSPVRLIILLLIIAIIGSGNIGINPVTSFSGHSPRSLPSVLAQTSPAPSPLPTSSPLPPSPTPVPATITPAVKESGSGGGGSFLFVLLGIVVGGMLLALLFSTFRLGRRNRK